MTREEKIDSQFLPVSHSVLHFVLSPNTQSVEVCLNSVTVVNCLLSLYLIPLVRSVLIIYNEYIVYIVYKV